MSCHCPPPEPPEPPPLRDEPCSLCTPYPHSLPCDYASDNQKFWNVEEAYKDGQQMLWNATQDAFNVLRATGDATPQLVIEDTPIHIDGCGCPEQINRLEPVGTVWCPIENRFMSMRSLHCPIEGGLELSPNGPIFNSLHCPIEGTEPTITR
jgi:hypothetical protein